MILVVDIGNTHTVVAVFNDDEKRSDWRVPSRREETPDDIQILIMSLFSLAAIPHADVNHVVMCSVVPSLLESWKRASSLYLGVEPVILENSESLGIINRYSSPAEVGADRLANVFMAYRRYARDLIVVDFGTATTFDVLNRRGEYWGGIIAPGIEISAGALAEKAARLTIVDISFPEKVVGDNTADSFRSGVLFGAVAMVEGVVKMIDEETGRKHFVVATGGLSELVSAKCGSIDVVDPLLTIYGLLEYHKSL